MFLAIQDGTIVPFDEKYHLDHNQYSIMMDCKPWM